MEEKILMHYRLHFTFMSKSTPMTSVKVETKSDFLLQEQKCIDFFGQRQVMFIFLTQKVTHHFYVTCM